MIILGILVLGMFAGWIANLILNRGRQPEWGLLLVAGLVGSLVGGTLGNLLTGEGFDLSFSGVIGSIVGAIIVLAVVGWWRARNRPAAPPSGGRVTPKGTKPRGR